MMEKAGLYGQSRNCQGFGLKGQEDQESEGNWDVNEAGMSLKVNEMRKYHPHQGFRRRGEVGDFASRAAGEANPRGLTHAVAIRYKDSGPSEHKPVIFRGIYRLQRKFALFLANLNANDTLRIRSLRILRCSLPSSINRLAKNRSPMVRGGRGAKQRGQDARSTTMDQHVPLEGRSDTGFTVLTHHVVWVGAIHESPLRR